MMKKFLMNVLTATMIVFAFAPAVNAAEVIQFDAGGQLGTYIQRFDQARTAESRFELDGLCISACTMITGLIDQSKVCATERAKLAFHSAFGIGPAGREHSPEGTRLLWELLSPEAQQAVRRRGWDGSDGSEHSDLIYVPALELYQRCS